MKKTFRIDDELLAADGVWGDGAVILADAVSCGELGFFYQIKPK